MWKKLRDRDFVIADRKEYKLGKKDIQDLKSENRGEVNSGLKRSVKKSRKSGAKSTPTRLKGPDKTRNVNKQTWTEWSFAQIESREATRTSALGSTLSGPEWPDRLTSCVNCKQRWNCALRRFFRLQDTGWKVHIYTQGVKQEPTMGTSGYVCPSGCCMHQHQLSASHTHSCFQPASSLRYSWNELSCLNKMINTVQTSDFHSYLLL